MLRQITLAITGATGVVLGFKLLEELLKINFTVHLLISNAALITIKEELALTVTGNPQKQKEIILAHLDLENLAANLHTYTNNDWYAPMASGCNNIEAMIVCPSSMATLAKIAHGISDELILRAADVMMKEHKKLIIVPRETPLSLIHLNNMQQLAAVENVVIFPLMPAFYNQPQSLEQMIEHLAWRIMQQLGLQTNLPTWGR